MIINHNMNAMNAHRNMLGNTGAAGKSMEKLSSGLRINRAGDDAAGLAISEKMRGQIRGLDQAGRNAQDGISMIQTGEGALNETHSILQRMRELAVQGASDTNDSDSRNAIQTEMNQLTSEVNRIGNTTEFNTQKLLNGGTATGVVGTVASTTTGVAATASAAEILGVYEMTITGTGSAAGTFSVGAASYTASASDTASSIATALAAAAVASGYTATATDGVLTITQKAGSGTATAIAGSTTGTGTVTTATTTAGASAVAAASGTAGVSNFTITTNLAKNDKIDIDGITYTAGTDFVIGSSAADTATNLAAKISSGTAYSATGSGASIVLTQKVKAATTPVVSVKSSGFNNTLQIGANQGQAFGIQINDMRAKSLGIAGTVGTVANGITDIANQASGTAGAKFVATNTVTDGTKNTVVEAALDISTHDNATNAIKVLDSAISSVSSERSKLGAYQNRLEHTIANLGTSSENLTSAESRIRDVDMAKEMMNFSKNNILSQAAQAMLSQANQQPQGVLQLLR